MGWHMIWTLLLIILFIGIVLWAFSSRRKADFDEAARLPLEDEDSIPNQTSNQKEKVDE